MVDVTMWKSTRLLSLSLIRSLVLEWVAAIFEQAAITPVLGPL
jgi:hypothetical protein